MSRFEPVSVRPDAFTGEPVALRAEIEVETRTPIDDQALGALVSDALESAISFGQSRYQILRIEMPSRRSAVESAARAVLERALHQPGQELVQFELRSLELAEPVNPR